MEGLGDELLAGAALAADEDGAVGARHLADGDEEVPDGRVVTDHLADGTRAGVYAEHARALRARRLLLHDRELGVLAGKRGLEPRQGDDLGLREERCADLGGQAGRELVANGEGTRAVSLRREEIACVAADDGEQRVDLAEEVLLAGGAGQGERAGRGLERAEAGGALDEGADHGDVGAAAVVRGELLGASHGLGGAVHVAVFERHAGRDPVCLAEVVAIAGGLAVDERGVDLAARELGVAAAQRDARADDGEVRRASGGGAVAEEAPTERERVLRVVDEPEAEPELREVRDGPRGGDAAAQRVTEADGLLPVPERRRVVVLPRGDDAEVRERVGAGAVLADLHAVVEDAREDDARVFQPALRHQRDSAVQAGAELGDLVAGGGGGEDVLGEVRVGVVPAGLDEAHLANRVAAAEAGTDRLRERDGAVRVLGRGLEVAGEVAALGELGGNAGAELVVVRGALGLLQRDARGDEIAELHQRLAHEERDGRVLGLERRGALAPALRVVRLAHVERAMGGLDAEKEASLAGDRRDAGEPAVRDLVGRLRVLDVADRLLDRAVRGLDGAGADEQLRGAGVGPRIGVEARAAGQELRSGEALGLADGRRDRRGVEAARQRDKRAVADREGADDELVDRGHRVVRFSVAEGGERGDGQRATGEREAREDAARCFTETMERARVGGEHATRARPPGLEGADIAPGQLGVGLLGDRAQPSQLVRGREIGDEVEGRDARGVGRARIREGARVTCVRPGDEDHEARARGVNELVRDGAVPRAFLGKNRDDRRLPGGRGARDLVSAGVRIARHDRQTQLGRDLAKERRSATRARGARRVDRQPTAGAQPPRRVGDDRRLHLV